MNRMLLGRSVIYIIKWLKLILCEVSHTWRWLSGPFTVRFVSILSMSCVPFGTSNSLTGSLCAKWQNCKKLKWLKRNFEFCMEHRIRHVVKCREEIVSRMNLFCLLYAGNNFVNNDDKWICTERSTGSHFPLFTAPIIRRGHSLCCDYIITDITKSNYFLLGVTKTVQIFKRILPSAIFYNKNHFSPMYKSSPAVQLLQMIAKINRNQLKPLFKSCSFSQLYHIFGVLCRVVYIWFWVIRFWIQVINWMFCEANVMTLHWAVQTR